MHERLTDEYGQGREESVRCGCPQSDRRTDNAKDLHSQKIQQDIFGRRYGSSGGHVFALARLLLCCRRRVPLTSTLRGGSATSYYLHALPFRQL